MTRFGLMPLVILAISALTACAPYIPHARVIRANYNVSRGEYQAAIVDYLRASETPEYRLWFDYNLANVYHYLGESEAARERWSEAQEGDVPDLVFGAAFNTGVYLYEQGRYDEAFLQFRYALSIDPRSLDSKQNLELVLEKLAAESELGEDSATTSGGGETVRAGGQAGAGTRMLDYVRRKEEQRWQASSRALPDGEARDW